MKLLVFFRTTSVHEVALAAWIAQEFGAAGWSVDRFDLDTVSPPLGSPPLGGRFAPIRRSAGAALSAQLSVQDLAVFAADQVVFADDGGPWLRQIAGWAAAAAVPVIAVARRVDISTRELRTIGVEAAYQAGSAAAIRPIATTWTPRPRPAAVLESSP